MGGLGPSPPLRGLPALWALPLLSGCHLGRSLGLLSSPGLGLPQGSAGAGLWKWKSGLVFEPLAEQLPGGGGKIPAAGAPQESPRISVIPDPLLWP